MKGISSIFIIMIMALFYFIMKPKDSEAEPDQATDLGPEFSKMQSTEPKGKYFHLTEFHCKDGTSVPPMYYGNLQKLIDNLDIIRENVGTSLHINSGFRSVPYNKRIGGVDGSCHTYAKAADLRPPSGWSSLKLAELIRNLINTGKIVNGGLGIYDNFVHYDIGSPRRWVESIKYKNVITPLWWGGKP